MKLSPKWYLFAGVAVLAAVGWFLRPAPQIPSGGEMVERAPATQNLPAAGVETPPPGPAVEKSMYAFVAELKDENPPPAIPAKWAQKSQPKPSGEGR